MGINFLRRLKPTRNTPTIIGYLIIAVGVFSRLMDAVDFFTIMKMVWEFFPNIWQFLTSGLGTLVVIVFGLFMIGYGSALHEKIKLNKESGRSRNIEDEQLGHILRTMMNKDNGSPDQCVLVEPKCINLEHVKDVGGPYLLFEFSVYNASVYTIKLDKDPTGHLMYEKQELKDSLEFLPGGLKPTINRTRSDSIQLRQFLLPEIANNIMDMADLKTKRASFDFQYVNLPMETVKPNGEIGNTWKCPLPREVSFTLPVDGLIAFPH